MKASAIKKHRKKKLYNVIFDGYQTLEWAVSPDDAIWQALVSQHEHVQASIATEEDIAHVQAMGGYVPPEPVPPFRAWEVYLLKDKQTVGIIAARHRNHAIYHVMKSMEEIGYSYRWTDYRVRRAADRDTEARKLNKTGYLPEKKTAV